MIVVFLYKKVSVFKGLDHFNCIIESSDENGEFIFIGHNGSLCCIDSELMTILDTVELIDERTQTKEGTNITAITTSRFNNQVHYVVSISDTGNISEQTENN